MVSVHSISLNQSSNSMFDFVISFGQLAFCNCQSLESILLSNSIKTLKENLFYNCNNFYYYHQFCRNNQQWCVIKLQ